MEKRGLGRGLEALIPDKSGIDKGQTIESNIQQGVANIPMDKVKFNKYQPREDFDKDALRELASSIKEKGVIQPILVRQRQEDYELIAANRSYFGDFDPFGDFDLIFGAAKLNLKIVDLPIRYRERTYGATNISRWKHGLLLMRMVAFAARRIKFV